MCIKLSSQIRHAQSPVHDHHLSGRAPDLEDTVAEASSIIGWDLRYRTSQRRYELPGKFNSKKQ
ncbi:hypothetical protein CDL15_Pgr011222 [Punica granatum]|uniref:Uncharacterized protein n=1 Tax=Punica granatum TaxID=22663 RepID=A0A218WE45_PUNGR|nr:hypothetical protein CDL15_Pgr011222 [Punica granatum]